MSEIEEIEDGPKEKNIDMTESDILVVGPEDCYQEYFPENGIIFLLPWYNILIITN